MAAQAGPSAAAVVPVAAPDEVDRSKHPSGIVPQLQNVVATVDLGCRLELKDIALHARNAEYNPKVRVYVATCGGGRHAQGSSRSSDNNAGRARPAAAAAAAAAARPVLRAACCVLLTRAPRAPCSALLP